MKLLVLTVIFAGSLFTTLPANAQGKPPEEAQPDLPFLGVGTVSAPPPLTSQLKLQPGFGLLVVDVVKESPAANAGLQVNDVLVKLDDQQLIEPNQLAVLVRSRKPDDQITLTLIRGGETKTQQVKIGKRPAPKNAMLEEPAPRTMLIRRDGAGGMVSMNGPGVPRDVIIGRAEPGKPLMIGGQVATMIVEGNKRFQLVSGPDGELLIVTDSDNKEIFRGVISNPEQREKVPEEFRAILNKMENIRGNMPPLSIPIPSPGAGEGIPVRSLTPEAS